MLLVLALACLPVEDGFIKASDLAPVRSAFGKLDPDVKIGYAPQFGVRRYYQPAELRRLAQKHGLELEGEVRAVCFERPGEKLEREALLKAMQDALREAGEPEVRIEILDYYRQPVPHGVVSFPRPVLPARAGKEPFLWRGRIRYAGNKSFPIWAKVKLSAKYRGVVAAVDLPAGKAIAAEQLRIEEWEGIPLARKALSSIEEAAGRIPRKTIQAGQPLYSALLRSAPEIQAGDAVDVDVRHGNAQLRLSAKALTAGEVGETILLRNPTSGKAFSAQVEGKGRAVVRPGLEATGVRRQP
mgnify:FL=1